MCLTLLSLLALVPPPPAPEITRLENGLQVVVLEDRTLPLLSVQLWCAAGARHDPPDQPGLCDAARMRIERRTALAWRLLAAGVRSESCTLPDAWYVSAVAPATPEFLAFVLVQEAALLAGAADSAGPVEAAGDLPERSIHSPGARSRSADPRLRAAAFGDHPYARTTEAVATSAPTFDDAKLAAFAARHFVAANATLFIYGDFDPPTARDLARRHFAALPAGDPPRQGSLPRLPATVDELRVTTAERRGVDFAWVTPPLGASDNLALDTLMHQLCNEVDGTLAARLSALAAEPERVDSAPASADLRYVLTWRHESWRECGLLVLSIDLARVATDAPAAASPSAAPPAARIDDEARLAGAIAAVHAELEAATTRVVAEVPFNRAGALSAADLRNADDTFHGRALRLATAEVVGGNAGLAWLPAARLAHLSVAELCSAAEFLRDTRRVIVRYVPDSEAATAPAPGTTSSQPRTTTAGTTDNFELFERLRDLQQAAPPLPNLQRVPRIVRQRTSGGTRITVCPLPDWGSVTVLLAAPPGLPHSPEWRVPLRVGAGAQPFTSARLRDYLTYHGIDFFASDGLLAITPPDRLAATLELQAHLLTSPAAGPLPPGEIVAAGELAPDGLCKAVPPLLTGDCTPCPPETTAPPAIATQAFQRIRSSWTEATAGAASPCIEVGIQLHGGREALRDAADQLAADALTVLLGGGVPPDAVYEPALAWVVERDRPWTWRLACERDWAAMLPAVESLLARLTELRTGALDDDLHATALYLARVRRITALDGPDPVVRAFWSGRNAPWSLVPELTPAGLRTRITALLGPAQVSLIVTAPPEPHPARTQLQRVLESAR